MDNLKPNILPFCICLWKKHLLKNETRKCTEEMRKETLDALGLRFSISFDGLPVLHLSHIQCEGIKNDYRKIIPSLVSFVFSPFFAEG